MTTDEKALGKIYERLALIMDEMPAIGKDSRNQAQKFDYRSIDDVYNVLHSLLAKHRVFFTPHVVHRDRQILDRLNRDTGQIIGKSVLMYVEVEYVLHCADDGSSMKVGPFPGEAADAGDKAAAKAMSLAMKGAMLQTFCIPIMGEKDWAEPNGSGQTNGAEGFLKNKRGQRDDAKRQAAKQTLPPETRRFRAACDALAARDCHGLTLMDADYKQIGQMVVTLANVNGIEPATEWLGKNGRLTVITDRDGEIMGIDVVDAEKVPA